MYEIAETIWSFAYRHLEVIGAVVGLIYLWLEYRASIHLWVAGVIMPAIYIFVYYDAGLYADCGISVYYLLAAAYGWAVWMWGRKRASTPSDDTQGITSLFAASATQMRHRVTALTAITAVLFLAIAGVLIHYTDSTVPWLDAFTTALSIIAMWMLARKYVEQWWVWIVVDVVSAGLYIYKELYFTAALYLLYAVIALFGYRKWVQLMKQTSHEE